MKPQQLEEERTELADERTLLSYIRTSLNILIFGVAINKFYPEAHYAQTIFVGSLITGTVLLIFGTIRYFFLLYKMKS
jgi:putative membrane protein